MQDFSKLVEEQINLGQQAKGVLGTPVMREFFMDAVKKILNAFYLADPNDYETLSTLAHRYQTLRLLHDHLTQAVTTGTVAAKGVHDNANTGDK